MYGGVSAIIYLKTDDIITARDIRRKYPKLCSVAGIIADILCWLLFAKFVLLIVPDFSRVFGRLVFPKINHSIAIASILCLAMLSQQSLTKVFEWAVFVHCGKVSFAMYLTHWWPVWCQKSVGLFAWFGHEGLISVFVMTIGLSTIIYWAIEIRIQKAATKLITLWHKRC